MKYVAVCSQQSVKNSLNAEVIIDIILVSIKR